jgi:ribonucleoside-triphosphate reductase
MESFSNSDTHKALGQIRNALAEQIRKEYKHISPNERDMKVEEILGIHGLTEDKFNIIATMENALEASTISEASIDDNSNKNEKGVASAFQESVNSHGKLLGYRTLYRAMKKLYGPTESKRLSGLMYDYTLSLADSSKILLPYCWAGDFSPIVTEGRKWGQLHSKPVKTVRSYVAALNETVHSLSNHLAGAVAIASFFTDIAKVMMDREEVPLQTLKEDPEVRKYIENCFQTFVHSMNSLSRTGGTESPFTNISIFDNVKCNQKATDLDYYFDNEDSDYVAEYIMELQRIYMDFFSKGDPTKNGIMYRFPVSTINIAKTEDNQIIDEKFLKEVVHQEIFRYNIFVSENNKDASCCRMISSQEMMNLGAEANSFGGGGVGRIGSHRVITIDYFRIAKRTNSLDEYIEELKKQLDDSAKILKAHKDMIIELQGKGLHPFIDRGYIDMSRMFSTLGIIGIVEGADIAESKFGITRDEFLTRVLNTVHTESFVLAEKYTIIVNIEQIPGESVCHRLPKTNRILLGEEECTYPLFANQFIPMWEDATLWDRMEIDGKYGSMFTGGGIVHFSLGERTLPKQNEKIIRHAVQTGCEHFSLNPIYSVCEECGDTKFAKLTTCGSCGSDNIEYYTRTVGFFTPVKSGWSKPKQEFDFKERTFKSVEE